MSSIIQVRYNTHKAYSALTKWRKSVTNRALDAETGKIARDAKKYARKITPKGHLQSRSRTRDMWELHRMGPSRYTIRNRTKVFKWINEGTKGHGARNLGNAFGGRMFLPISIRAKRAGVRGVMENRRRFRYGRDFILVYYVRGIKAMNITGKVSKRTALKASNKLRAYLRRSLAQR